MAAALVALVLALGLGGCASMLEREYLVTQEHVENAPGEGGDAYRVETYSALVSALDAYVEEGMDTGVLRFPTTYPNNLTVDLEKAKRQLLEEEPLGCYALTDLTYHTSRIIAYYEVNFTFDYREEVEPSTLSGLPRVNGQGKLEELLRETLTDLEGGFTVLLSMSDADEKAVREVLDKVLDDDPALAAGAPALELTLYPQRGTRVVLEGTFTYPGGVYGVRRARERLEEAAGALLEGAEGGPEELQAALREACVYDETAGSSAFEALVDGTANQEGMARAFYYLCKKRGLPCALLRDGERFRVAVTDPGVGQSYELDPAAPAEPTDVPAAQDEEE